VYQTLINRPLESSSLSHPVCSRETTSTSVLLASSGEIKRVQHEWHHSAWFSPSVQILTPLNVNKGHSPFIVIELALIDPRYHNNSFAHYSRGGITRGQRGETQFFEIHVAFILQNDCPILFFSFGLSTLLRWCTRIPEEGITARSEDNRSIQLEVGGNVGRCRFSNTLMGSFPCLLTRGVSTLRNPDFLETFQDFKVMIYRSLKLPAEIHFNYLKILIKKLIKNIFFGTI